MHFRNTSSACLAPALCSAVAGSCAACCLLHHGLPARLPAAPTARPCLPGPLAALAARPPPCRRAAAWEHPEAVKLLVELGADVCHTNHMGHSA